jgi:imidazolonepropionase-like amidohydrolase
MAQKNIRIYDAHGHLSLSSEHAIDSLVKYKVYGLRDCGGSLVELKRLRDEISHGKRKGPKLIISGPFLDGPKKTQRGEMTVFITTETHAYKVVDSLKSQGVDFLKTHNGLTRENYFAILSQARKQNLKVVSHLPKGVTAWEAAVRGVSCIEHLAESILASPIYAGYVKTPKEAADWWLNSPKADSVIALMAERNTFVTPTLVAFRTLVEMPENSSVRGELEKGFDDLLKITLKLHRGGVIILAGTDFNSITKIQPGKSIYEEIDLLVKAGLSKKEANDAASKNFELWLKK